MIADAIRTELVPGKHRQLRLGRFQRPDRLFVFAELVDVDCSVHCCSRAAVLIADYHPTWIRGFVVATDWPTAIELLRDDRAQFGIDIGHMWSFAW